MQKKSALVTGSAATVALLVGIGLGAASGGTSEATPEPAPTVTVTPAPEVKEKRVEVVKTPDSCRVALDLADQGFRYAGEGFAIVGEIFGDLQYGDYSNLPTQNKRLGEVLEKSRAVTPEYNTQKTACRAGK